MAVLFAGAADYAWLILWPSATRVVLVGLYDQPVGTKPMALAAVAAGLSSIAHCAARSVGVTLVAIALAAIASLAARAEVGVYIVAARAAWAVAGVCAAGAFYALRYVVAVRFITPTAVPALATIGALVAVGALGCVATGCVAGVAGLACPAIAAFIATFALRAVAVRADRLFAPAAPLALAASLTHLAVGAPAGAFFAEIAATVASPA